MSRARSWRSGPDVRDLAIGDEVVGELAGGGLAEYVSTPAARLVPAPQASTPSRRPRSRSQAEPPGRPSSSAPSARRQRVLVIGASGGVGTFAVQLAALRGAEVWALCGARSRALVEELGASRTFDYTATDAAGLPPASFDAVIDIAGTALAPSPQRARSGPVGTLVLVSGEGGRVLGPIGRILSGDPPRAHRAGPPHPPARGDDEARDHGAPRRARGGGLRPPGHRAHVAARGGAARRSRTWTPDIRSARPSS